ncbi:MAG: PadR family transcriptional regulator [Scytolyngbya sp. HA4215-MV1]|jgi:DNA-binding PadR family transcriptional regulator|nr:PadR family transcriptional regulator [Scytolyngbya sp. HA4215-MV1]
MQLEDVYQFFKNPPIAYLNYELAVGYIFSVLLKKDSYGTELIQLLEVEHPNYRLSDTVLYGALNFLEGEGLITSYWKKLEGRGRPRRMYQILPQAQTNAEDLAQLWETYMENNRKTRDPAE